MDWKVKLSQLLSLILDRDDELIEADWNQVGITDAEKQEIIREWLAFTEEDRGC